MGGNNEFFENFERNKYLKKLPSMQRVKEDNGTLSCNKLINTPICEHIYICVYLLIGLSHDLPFPAVTMIFLQTCSGRILLQFVTVLQKVKLLAHQINYHLLISYLLQTSKCFNVSENVVKVSNSLKLGETPRKLYLIRIQAFYLGLHCLYKVNINDLDTVSPERSPRGYNI